MKLWIDDVRSAPDGYVWCKSVNQAKHIIMAFIELCKGNFDEFKLEFDKACEHEYDGSDVYLFDENITVIDIDHDAGEYASDGGDYIKLLDWLEETGRNYPIRIHSMNPVGVQNMRRIIQKNGWKEIV